MQFKLSQIFTANKVSSKLGLCVILVKTITCQQNEEDSKSREENAFRTDLGKNEKNEQKSFGKKAKNSNQHLFSRKNFPSMFVL